MPRAAATSDPPPSIGQHAADELRFIRHAMERSAVFTAVPGHGGILMGVCGMAAASIGAMQPTMERWLMVWLTAAAVAFGVGLVTMRRKAARAGQPISGVAGRRFALSMAAPLVAGAALTIAAWRHGAWSLMPPVWLLLYGVGVLTGGAHSVAPLRWLGVLYMAVGLAAIATPASWGHAWLAIGFGVLHIIFGATIARRYGG
jgi:hypothetical protein